MYRSMLATALAIGLASTSGCFNRPTEPQQKTELGGGNFDRLKTVKGGGAPKDKVKGSAPTAGSTKPDAGKSGQDQKRD